MTTKTIIRMKLDRTTKGAVRLQEVDAAGKELHSDDDGALVATQYLRKKKLAEILGLSQITDANVPKQVTLEISVG